MHFIRKYIFFFGWILIYFLENRIFIDNFICTLIFFLSAKTFNFKFTFFMFFLCLELAEVQSVAPALAAPVGTKKIDEKAFFDVSDK